MLSFERFFASADVISPIRLKVDVLPGGNQ